MLSFFSQYISSPVVARGNFYLASRLAEPYTAIFPCRRTASPDVWGKGPGDGAGGALGTHPSVRPSLTQWPLSLSPDALM